MRVVLAGHRGGSRNDSCGPPGPRALLAGKKDLDRGKYQAAIEELKQATQLMKTNANAWNYLGLAYHHTGQAREAIAAYQQALKEDASRRCRWCITISAIAFGTEQAGFVGSGAQ